MELTAFGGLMIATNVFNNALQVELDDYLQPFRRFTPTAAETRGAPVMSRELAGRVALITGAAHGQGRAARWLWPAKECTSPRSTWLVR